MLDLEVQPERGLVCPRLDWELVLGMPLIQAISVLRRSDADVKSVQLWYSDRLPMLMDIVLSLTQDGIKLIFDATYQRLKSIEVFDLTKLRLSYCNQSFNSPPGVTPTFATIQQCFGATHPLVHDMDRDADVLGFRGVSFTFPRGDASSRSSTMGFSDDASTGSSSYPAYFPPFDESDDPVPCLVPANGISTAPWIQASGMFIFLGNCLSEPRLPQQVPPDCLRDDRVFLERLRLVRSGGLTRELVFQLYCLEPPTSAGAAQPAVQRCEFERRLRFGDSVQDVESSLGCPSQVFYKSEDKMRIHSKDPARRRPRIKRSDYFYNYFALGVDLLFDGLSHTLCKAVLHTNFPGHYNFNTYYRCFFDLTLGESVSPGAASGASQQSQQQQQLTINQFTRWDEISDCLGKQADRPVVLNRHDSTNTVNPFGPTYCYGHEDLIFEVIPCNGQLASVTVYQTDG